MNGKILRVAALLSLLWCLMPVQPAGATAEFYRDLNRKEEATVGDVIRCAAHLKGYRGPAGVDREISFLLEQGIGFGNDIRSELDRPLTTGEAVHTVLTAIKLKRSLGRWMFPKSRRYAMRAAIDLNLVPADRRAGDVMSGAELLSFVSRVVEFLERSTK